MTNYMAERINISLENKISEIVKAVEKFEQFGEEKELSLKIINTVNLALDEILTNTISYGYKDSQKHIIELEIEIGEKEITVTITDDAEAFNPLEKEEPNVSQSVEDKPVGGLGIHLIKNLMDKLEYKRVNEKNIFIMRKKLISE